MDCVDRPQNCKDLYGILQLLRGSYLNNFLLKTLKLGWVAFHSVTFQLKCLDFQSNQCKKLVPVLSRFCNWLLIANHTFCSLGYSTQLPPARSHVIMFVESHGLAVDGPLVVSA